MSFQNHLSTATDLITAEGVVETGVSRLALEMRHHMTPCLMEVATFKIFISKITTPLDLLNADELRPAILTAAGIPDAAKTEITEAEQSEVIRNLMDHILEMAGKDFIDELVLRFQLARSRAVEERAHNLTNLIAEQKMTRSIITILSLYGRRFSWLHADTFAWIPGDKNAPDIERHIRGLYWTSKQGPRTLLYNFPVPIVGKEIGLCLLEATPAEIIVGNRDSNHYRSNAYLALGELKGGIDPAGADEQANTAPTRARNAFSLDGHKPYTFFIGAAIASAMAEEIFLQLQRSELTNAANLTSEQQVVSLCQWLVTL